MPLIDSIKKETCYVGIEAKTDEEALGILSDKLCDLGIVNEDFKENVILRERNFSTGLPLTGYKVAIPHTDACYVNETRICVAVLKNPVDFRVMGSSDGERVPVHLIIMLAIKEQHAQLEVLKELINLVVQNEKMIEEIILSKDGNEIYEVLNKHLTKA